MFELFEIIFPVMFILVIGMFIFIFVQNITEWAKNNNSPRLSVHASVVTKRSHSHRHGDHGSTTSYYVTFQVDSGDRMELHMSGREYGMLAEGDTGMLTFQGTRYLGFERE